MKRLFEINMQCNMTNTISAFEINISKNAEHSKDDTRCKLIVRSEKTWHPLGTDNE